MSEKTCANCIHVNVCNLYEAALRLETYFAARRMREEYDAMRELSDKLAAKCYEWREKEER